MFTRVLALSGFAFLFCTLRAQQPAAPSLKTFASSAEVQALIANAKKLRTANQPLISQTILELEPYKASLEYRASVGTAAIHEKEVEMFYVIDGAATLVTGGKLVNGKRSNAENLSGSGIDGGVSQAIAKGDFAIVPENTPHWFNDIKGVLVLMSLHVPRSAAK
jgi:mannose-6-phosphate isomerase-like protein (cupin superfamily)